MQIKLEELIDSFDNIVLFGGVGVSTVSGIPDFRIVDGSVYPAAGLIDYYHGDKLVLINKSQTSADKSANLCITEPIGVVLAQVSDGV